MYIYFKDQEKYNTAEEEDRNKNGHCLRQDVVSVPSRLDETW